MKTQFIPSKNICYKNKIPTWHCDA